MVHVIARKCSVLRWGNLGTGMLSNLANVIMGESWFSVWRCSCVSSLYTCCRMSLRILGACSYYTKMRQQAGKKAGARGHIQPEVPFLFQILLWVHRVYEFPFQVSFSLSQVLYKLLSLVWCWEGTLCCQCILSDQRGSQEICNRLRGVLDRV